MRSDDELLTTEQLAAVRNVPVSRLHKERITGDGPPFNKDRNLVRYRWGDYRDWLQGQKRYTSTSELEAV